MLLQVDLAGDDRLPALARLAAAEELAGTAGRSPVSGLFAPVVATVLARSVDLTDQIGDGDLDALDPGTHSRLVATLRAAAPEGGPAARSLADLVDRAGRVDPARWASVESPTAFAVEMLDSDLPVRASSRRPGPPATAAGHPEVEELEVRWVTRGVARVATHRSARERWVRVTHRDDQVLLAQARLSRDGLVDRAEVAILDGLDSGDLIVDVVAAEDLPEPGGPLDAVRAAVRTGGDAARAARLDLVDELPERWERCARLWERAGNPRRAEGAGWMAEPFAARQFLGPALLADEIAHTATADR
jgi:hypothetical protein